MAELMGYSQDIEKAASLNLPWEKLEDKNILITGATGLIGSCIVEVLLYNPKRQCHVYAAGRNEQRAMKRFEAFANDKRFHFFTYDVTEPLSSSIDFHYIIHAASNASPNFFAEKPVEVMMSNINGVNNLLMYGKEHHLERFLFVSTGEVYGEGDGRVFTEDYQGYVNINSPRSCYPSSKRAAETLCAAYSKEYGIDYIIARPCHTYGPHFTEADNRVYAQFIRNVLNGEDIIMKSTGSQMRSWCYVVDCVSAILHILLKGNEGEAYNIADAESNISIRELAEMIARIGGKEVIIQLPSDAEKQSFNPVTKSVFATDKLQSLGWSITGQMIDKIKSTIEEIKTLNG